MTPSMEFIKGFATLICLIHRNEAFFIMANFDSAWDVVSGGHTFAIGRCRVAGGLRRLQPGGESLLVQSREISQ